MLLLPVKSRKVTFAVKLMIVDAQLRERDTEGFCDNSNPRPPTQRKSNVLDRKPSRRKLKQCDKDAEAVGYGRGTTQFCLWGRPLRA